MMPGVGVLIALAAGYWIFKKHPAKKVSQVPHFKAQELNEIVEFWHTSGDA